MRDHLRRVFEEVRTYLLGEGRRSLGVVQQNLHGDMTKEFDYNAEERIITYFRREVPGTVRILTEERGEVLTRAGPPEWTLVVDPVDGSDNYARGNEWVSVSLALLPSGGDPRPQAVQYALVGNVFTGTICDAVRGEGVWRNGVPAKPSTITELGAAVVLIDMNFRQKDGLPRIYPLLQRSRDIRRFGTAAAEFAAVCYGGAEVYVDARDTLTPENYMAAYLLVDQAGGTITDRRGEPLAPVRSMAQGQSIVAAANRRIHDAVMEALAAGGS